MVDWDVAVSIGSRIAGDGPAAAPAEMAQVRRRAAGRGRAVHRPGARASPAWSPPIAPPRCWWSTGPAGSAPTPRASPPSSSRSPTSWPRTKGAPTRPVAGRRLPRHRRRGRPAAGLPRRQGARPVRPVLRPGTAGCCWWRPTSCRSSASSAPTRPTSGSGCACTRRPTGCSSPPSRGCATTSSSEVAALVETVEPTRIDRGPRPPARRVRSAATAAWSSDEHARAARDPRPGHRHDVAARGPRRRGDGRRRTLGDPLGGQDPRASSTSAARASARSTGCCADCSGSRPRWRSTATAPPSSAAVVDKVGMEEFNAVWAGAGEPAQQGRDRRPRRLGHPRPGLTTWRCIPPSPPSVAAYAADLADLDAGRRGGGRLLGWRRLAGAAGGHRGRGPGGRAGGSSAPPSTTASRRLRPSWPPGGGADGRRWASTRP